MPTFLMNHLDFSKQEVKRKEFAFWMIGIVITDWFLVMMAISSFYGVFGGSIATAAQSSVTTIAVTLISLVGLLFSCSALLFTFVAGIAKTVGRLRDVCPGYDVSMIAAGFFIATLVPFVHFFTLAIFFIPTGYFAQGGDRTSAFNRSLDTAKNIAKNTTLKSEDGELAELRRQVEKEELKRKLDELNNKAS